MHGIKMVCLLLTLQRDHQFKFTGSRTDKYIQYMKRKKAAGPLRILAEISKVSW